MAKSDPKIPMLDAHCHFWRLDRGDYDWLIGDVPALSPIQRDFLPADYPAQGRRVIAVQAAASQEEADYLLSLAQENSFIAGVVGWVDLTATESTTWLEQRSENPKFKGVRPMLQDIADTEWLVKAPRQDVIDCLVRLGLRFDALVTERHLPVLLRFVKSNPDLPVVIDHGAKPQPDDNAAWEDGMRALAEIPYVHCKLSGLLTELSPGQLRDPQPRLEEIFDKLLQWFGPHRLIWGSDWPVVTLAEHYDSWFERTHSLLARLTEGERSAILHDNGVRFYGLDA